MKRAGSLAPILAVVACSSAPVAPLAVADSGSRNADGRAPSLDGQAEAADGRAEARDGSQRHDATGSDSATHEGGGDAGSTTLSFGPGLTAVLRGDGQLTITQGDNVVLTTTPGQALFSSAIDTADPTGWHDPKTLGGDTFTPLPPAGVGMMSPSPGILQLTASDARADVVLESLALASDGGFYTGLGERYDHVDPRGGDIVGMQLEIDATYESGTTDRHVPVPWIVSSRGYGVFVKNRMAGAWDVATTDPSVVRCTFEGNTLDVTVVVDPDPLAIVATFTEMTGLQRNTPTWALAPMMWRHVDSQAELLSDVAQIRSLHIPTTTYWIDDGWQVAIDTLDFTPTKYTDAGAMLAQMASLGLRVFGWNSPYLEVPVASDGGPNESEMLYPMAAADGYFVEQSGVPFAALGPGGGSAYGLLDYTSAAATSFWVGRASAPVALGLDGFKLDYGEDLVPSLLGQRLGVTLSDGETERTARNYPLDYHGAYRKALTAGAALSDAGPSDGGVLVVRASTYGGASVADIVWPGDLDNGFQLHGAATATGTLFVGGLPASVVAMQSLSASGFALYGADIGGYREGMPTEESLLRWAETSALSMVMQLGPCEDKYPWLYDASTVTTYTALANLHQTLVPYLATLLVAAQKSGTPTLEPLPLAFPADTDAPMFADTEYLLGPWLLAAPVTTEGVTSRQVHLPPGVWFPWWGGPPLQGPATMTAQAPIGQPPLYVLAGALLPLLPPGIDTLVASNDPSTVSLSAKAGEDVAQGWVSGNASTTFLDGSSLEVTDAATGVTVSWTPIGTGKALTVTLDLSQRKGTASALTVVTVVTGGALTPESSASAAASAATSAYFLAGNQAVLRLVGPASVQITP